MKLKLFVSGKLIKEMTVFITDYRRTQEVDYLTCYLKKRFSDILKVTDDWQIFLSVKSKMNVSEESR